MLARTHDCFDDSATPMRALALDICVHANAIDWQWTSGGRHALAVSPSSAFGGNGDVWSWGDDEYGQCARQRMSGAEASMVSASSVPVRIGFALPVRRVACGWFHSALVTDDGALFSWGCGQHFQLGLGDARDRSTPERVAFDEDVRIADASLGWKHSLALASDGRAFAFGVNTTGQLGVGDEAPRMRPALILIASHVVSLAAGWKHSAFLDGPLT